MKEWDRQRLHDIELTRQVTEQVTKQVTKDLTEQNTIDFIRLMREDGISDDRIKSMVEKKGDYTGVEVDDLLLKAESASLNV